MEHKQESLHAFNLEALCLENYQNVVIPKREFFMVYHIIPLIALTQFSPVLYCYTPWKHQKTQKFSDVFRG